MSQAVNSPPWDTRANAFSSSVWGGVAAAAARSKLDTSVLPSRASFVQERLTELGHSARPWRYCTPPTAFASAYLTASPRQNYGSLVGDVSSVHSDHESIVPVTAPARCAPDAFCQAPTDLGRSYRGTASYTRSGRRCQRWNARYPNDAPRFVGSATSGFTETRFPGTGVDGADGALSTHNYCQNSLSNNQYYL